MTKGASFPLFSSLPPELRNMIWQSTLTQEIEPHLCFLEHEPPWEETYDDFGPPWGLNKHSVEEIQVDLPLAFVNHEVRRIALAWASQQGLTMRVREDKQLPVFVRPFNNTRDALYISGPTFQRLQFGLDAEWGLLGRGSGRINTIVIPNSLFKRASAVTYLLRASGCRHIVVLSQGPYPREGGSPPKITPAWWLDIDPEFSTRYRARDTGLSWGGNTPAHMEKSHERLREALTEAFSWSGFCGYTFDVESAAPFKR